MTRFLLLGRFSKCGLELPTYFLSFSSETISEFGQPYVGRTSNKATATVLLNSTTQSQAPEDGYINVRNMLST